MSAGRMTSVRTCNGDAPSVRAASSRLGSSFSTLAMTRENRARNRKVKVAQEQPAHAIGEDQPVAGQPLGHDWRRCPGARRAGSPGSRRPPRERPSGKLSSATSKVRPGKRCRCRKNPANAGDEQAPPRSPRPKAAPWRAGCAGSADRRSTSQYAATPCGPDAPTAASRTMGSSQKAVKTASAGSVRSSERAGDRIEAPSDAKCARRGSRRARGWHRGYCTSRR